MTAFVDEIAVDGELLHLLLCGHIVPAENDPETGDPTEFRECPRCIGKAKL